MQNHLDNDIEILNFIRPYLKVPPPLRPDGSWAPGPLGIDLNRIIVDGWTWAQDEDRRKKLKKYRDALQKALEIRDGDPHLKIYFPRQGDIPTPPGARVIHIHQPADSISDMIETCDRILGELPINRELYSRKKIIGEALSLWRRYTGENPQKWAKQPNSYGSDKEAPPYTFCRLILAAIEGNNDTGNFSRIYRSQVLSFLKKYPPA